MRSLWLLRWVLWLVTLLLLLRLLLLRLLLLLLLLLKVRRWKANGRPRKGCQTAGPTSRTDAQRRQRWKRRKPLLLGQPRKGGLLRSWSDPQQRRRCDPRRSAVRMGKTTSATAAAYPMVLISPSRGGGRRWQPWWQVHALRCMLHPRVRTRPLT